MAYKTQILCFHRVSDEFSPAYPPIPVRVFDKILSYISRNYLVIPLEEIGENFTTKKSKLVITFDDAFYDFYENALPLLRKYKFSAIQHVITNCAESGESFWTQRLNKIVETYYNEKQKLSIPELNISKTIENAGDVEQIALNLYFYLLDNDQKIEYLIKLESNLNTPIVHTRMMNWQELNECTKHGISIGSHTHDHATLTRLNEAELKFELEHSRKLVLENIPSTQCLSLAFPNGKYNDVVAQIACYNGYKYLLSTETPSIITDNNNMVLPRFSIYNTEWWKNHIKLLYIRYMK